MPNTTAAETLCSHCALPLGLYHVWLVGVPYHPACLPTEMPVLDVCAAHSAKLDSLVLTLASVRQRAEKAEAELDRERQRLAACGVAALGYFQGCHDDYKSASLDDVLSLHTELAASQAICSARQDSLAHSRAIIASKDIEIANLTHEALGLRAKLAAVQYALDNARLDAHLCLRERNEARAEVERLSNIALRFSLCDRHLAEPIIPHEECDKCSKSSMIRENLGLMKSLVDVRAEVAAYRNLAQVEHRSPCTLGPLCPYCAIERLSSEVAALKRVVGYANHTRFCGVFAESLCDCGYAKEMGEYAKREKPQG